LIWSRFCTHKSDLINPFITSDLLEESTAGEEENFFLAGLRGDPSPPPLGKMVKEPEAMPEERSTRKSFADEECETPRNASASVASFSPAAVDANSDVSAKEVRREADLIQGDSGVAPSYLADLINGI
jgi:hypothetical protein